MGRPPNQGSSPDADLELDGPLCLTGIMCKIFHLFTPGADRSALYFCYCTVPATPNLTYCLWPEISLPRRRPLVSEETVEIEGGFAFFHRHPQDQVRAVWVACATIIGLILLRYCSVRPATQRRSLLSRQPRLACREGPGCLGGRPTRY